MARQGALPFTIGTAIILGANIGTTITPMIASLEYNRNVKRLAIAHILIKIGGVFMTLLFFQYFLLLVDVIVPGTPQQEITIHLAAVHTIFNFFNLLLWSALSRLCVEFLFMVIPSHGYDKESQDILPIRVRQMLARHPQQAFKEIDKQMARLQDLNKWVVDYNLGLLIEGKNGRNASSSKIMARKYDNFNSVIYDLLVRLKQNPLSLEENKKIDQRLRVLADLSSFYHINLAFKVHIEKGIVLEKYQIFSEKKNLFEEFQKGCNDIWLKMVLDNPSTTFGPNLKEISQDLEKLYSYYLTKQEEINTAQLYWLYEVIRFQRQLVASFFVLYQTTLENKQKHDEK